MLALEKFKAFIPTINAHNARSFYESVFGLKLLSEDQYALEFDANGTLLRLIIVQDLKPYPFTVLGWNVDDIACIIKQLNDKNVCCERYNFFEHDNLGIWLSPGGSKVAWFKDPDGNILALTE